MSCLLWYGSGDNDAISLGSALHVLPAFAELGNMLGDDPDYAELQSVPGFLEQDVSLYWLGLAAQQASRVLKEKSESLSPVCQDVLMRLTEGYAPLKKDQSGMEGPADLAAGVQK